MTGRDRQRSWYARDPISQQPQFKSSPVAIRRKSFSALEQWLVDRCEDLGDGSAQPYAAREI